MAANNEYGRFDENGNWVPAPSFVTDDDGNMTFSPTDEDYENAGYQQKPENIDDSDDNTTEEPGGHSSGSGTTVTVVEAKTAAFTILENTGAMATIYTPFECCVIDNQLICPKHKPTTQMPVVQGAGGSHYYLVVKEETLTDLEMEEILRGDTELEKSRNFIVDVVDVKRGGQVNTKDVFLAISIGKCFDEDHNKEIVQHHTGTIHRSVKQPRTIFSIRSEWDEWKKEMVYYAYTPRGSVVYEGKELSIEEAENDYTELGGPGTYYCWVDSKPSAHVGSASDMSSARRIDSIDANGNHYEIVYSFKICDIENAYTNEELAQNGSSSGSGSGSSGGSGGSDESGNAEDYGGGQEDNSKTSTVSPSGDSGSDVVLSGGKETSGTDDLRPTVALVVALSRFADSGLDSLHNDISADNWGTLLSPHCKSVHIVQDSKATKERVKSLMKETVENSGGLAIIVLISHGESGGGVYCYDGLLSTNEIKTSIAGQKGFLWLVIDAGFSGTMLNTLISHRRAVWCSSADEKCYNNSQVGSVFSAACMKGCSPDKTYFQGAKDTRKAMMIDAGYDQSMQAHMHGTYFSEARMFSTPTTTF